MHLGGPGNELRVAGGLRESRTRVAGFISGQGCTSSGDERMQVIGLKEVVDARGRRRIARSETQGSL